MKNLILTMGIILLMTMGLVYDADCMQVTRQLRYLEWVCEEMADAAEFCVRTQHWDMAESMAEDVFEKNKTEYMRNAVWNLEKEGSMLTVKVTAGPISLRLPFLDNQFCLSHQAERNLQTKS